MKNKLIALALILSMSFLAASVGAKDDKGTKEKKGMKVLTPANMPSVSGPVENFTGTVKVTPLVSEEEQSNLSGAGVRFSASARSAWHTHPRGQILVVTEGSGLVQEWGKPIRKIQKGDIVWTPPNVKHWHGAGPATSMTHTAIQEALNGKVVEWMEKVTDEQYKMTPE